MLNFIKFYLIIIKYMRQELYRVITYGCQMNKSDSERIAAVLDKTEHILAVTWRHEHVLELIHLGSIKLPLSSLVFFAKVCIEEAFIHDKPRCNK